MHDIFIRTQLGQPHGAAGVELLGADAHLAAKAELSAVGKAGAGVHVDRRAVHAGREPLCRRGVRRDDGLTVVGRMLRNVGDGRIDVIHNGHAQLIIQILGVKVLRRGGHTVDDGRGARVQMQLHRGDAGSGAGIDKAGLQHRQKLRCHVPVDQQRLFGVADAGAARLGVFHNIHGHLQIGGLVHVDMADAGAGLDAGHGCVLDAGADQPGPAAGDQQIDQPVCGHQLVGAGVGGVLDEAHRALRQAHPAQTGAQGLHDGVAAGPGIAPAAQDARAARLDGQRGGVARDVGAALVDDGDDAHRHGGFFDQKAVRAHNFAKHCAHRVGQGRDLAHTLGHVGQAARRQRQTVQHHVADPPAGVLDVLLIGVQNFILRGDERNGHRLQRGVFRVGVGQRQRQLCALRGLQNFLRSHGVRPPLCLAAHEPGADGLALDNVVQHLGVGTVGNDHVHTGLGGTLGGGDLRQHAAGAQGRARAARQHLNFRRDLLDHRDELCVRVGVRVGGVQAVDVGHQHDQIGVDALGHQRGQRVVVAQRVFLAGDGVILVDDRDGVQL